MMNPPTPVAGTPNKLIDRLQEALDRAGNTHTLEDVRDAIDRGDAQLWINEEAIVVTEIKVAPRKKTLHVWLGAGEMDHVLALHEEAVEWGREMGCDRATVVGRKGWERIGERYGFRYTSSILVREF